MITMWEEILREKYNLVSSPEEIKIKGWKLIVIEIDGLSDKPIRYYYIKK